MKRKTAFLVFLLSIFFTTAFCQTDKTTTVRAYLKPKQGIPLNYVDVHHNEVGLYLRNDTEHDTVITRTINTTMDLELMTRVIRNQRGVKRSFLARCNDTVELKLAGGDMIEIHGRNIFPQDYLDHYDELHMKLMKPFIAYTSAELADYYLECEGSFRRNLSKIDSLHRSGKISASDKDFFLVFNEIDHYLKKLGPIRGDRPHYAKGAEGYIEKDITAIKNLIKTLRSYRTIELTYLLRCVTNYDLYKNKIEEKDLLTVYKAIISQGYGDMARNEILYRIKTYPDKSSASIRSTLGALAKDTYAEQLAEINTLLLGLDQRNKNVPQAENIKLENANGKVTTLNEIFKKHKGNVLVVDLWASWCIPCRSQMPMVKRLKEKYKSLKIKFLSVSLDIDSAQVQWIAAMKQDGNLNDADHYRLLDPKHSIFTRFYKITSIPRYMVFNADGKMLDDDFIDPTDSQFEKKIMTYLQH